MIDDKFLVMYLLVFLASVSTRESYTDPSARKIALALSGITALMFIAVVFEYHMMQQTRATRILILAMSFAGGVAISYLAILIKGKNRNE